MHRRWYKQSCNVQKGATRSCQLSTLKMSFYSKQEVQRRRCNATMHRFHYTAGNVHDGDKLMQFGNYKQSGYYRVASFLTTGMRGPRSQRAASLGSPLAFRGEGSVGSISILVSCRCCRRAEDLKSTDTESALLVSSRWRFRGGSSAEFLTSIGGSS